MLRRRPRSPHFPYTTLFRSSAESNEHGAMITDGSVGHVAAKDFPKLVLMRASYMRIRWLVLEFDAVELGATHDPLLLIDRQRDRKSTRLNSSHLGISYAVFC